MSIAWHDKNTIEKSGNENKYPKTLYHTNTNTKINKHLHKHGYALKQHLYPRGQILFFCTQHFYYEIIGFFPELQLNTHKFSFLTKTMLLFRQLSCQVHPHKHTTHKKCTSFFNTRCMFSALCNFLFLFFRWLFFSCLKSDFFYCLMYCALCL